MSEQRIHAPELPGNLDWFNVRDPLKLRDQRGKVVLLDFWSYCCINCQHVLPDLRYLEDKYGDRLVIIGVHSPKFPSQRGSAHVQKAINRLHIRHPVVSDPSLELWRQYGVKAWPTFVLIDAEGYVVGALRGEGRRKQLDMLIAEHLDRAEGKGVSFLNPVPVSFRPESAAVLSFPGKVLASTKRLFIADSGHNRVIETSKSGRITRIYGSKGPGFLDGQGTEAAFRNPQGLALVNDFLYVADAGNHALRRITLRTGDVQTVAGTGKQGRSAERSGDPLRTPLNSPWDLAYSDGSLYIAMAGQHTLWRLQLMTNSIGLFTGTGREDLVDGAPDSAAFAQPSALAIGDQTLYVADAEASAVRRVRLPDGQVSTEIGEGLFVHGDVDGDPEQARLQHPTGLAFDPVRNVVYIADGFNHKIKEMNSISKKVYSIWSGAGLDEPGGISLDGDDLWIANTNAHEICRINLVSGVCETIEIHE